MTNSLIIKPMGICAVAVTVGMLAGCGGGGGESGSAASVATGAEVSQPAASAVGTAPVTPPADLGNDPSVLDTRSASERQVEVLSLINEGKSMTASMLGGGPLPDGNAPQDATSLDDQAVMVAASTVADANSVSTLGASLPSTRYLKLTDENHTFTVTGTALVRYGAAAANKWVTKLVTGNGECTNASFGIDPAVGIVKTCETPTSTLATLTTTATWSKPTGKMPAVDLSKIPTPWVGANDVRIQPTAELAPASDIGQFRTVCTVARIAFDDPIVFPGQPGKSHLHTFFGNNGVNANSTSQSLRATGESTCRAGIANRSAYWVPSIIDTRTGTPMIPDAIGVYYKSGYVIAVSKMNLIPAGLRMIAGNAASTGVGSEGTGFQCQGGPNNEDDNHGQQIGNCDVGAQLVQWVNFPQCWDGVNLDSPDHKSHMAYGSNSSCPATHPVALPAITFNVSYTVTEKNQALHWRLSSDNYDSSLPGGYSAHGDWFNGWDPAVSDAWGKNCIKASKDCHSHLLGDGRMMY